MTTFNSTSYAPRTDGMRTYKTNSTGSTSYRYDGQMGMEDIDYAANGSVSKVTDYGIGARGVDAMYVTQNGTTTPAYPIYDAHGNMISTLSKQGSCFATSALRTFDSWGNIRLGAQTGDPKGRYCASLGHKQDDESSLVYMQSRYYEPSNGRFVNEDLSRAGSNWFEHCNNDPINYRDANGQKPLKVEGGYGLNFSTWVTLGIMCGLLAAFYSFCNAKAATALMIATCFFFGVALGETNQNHWLLVLSQMPAGLLAALVATSAFDKIAGENSETAALAGILTLQVCVDVAALCCIDDGS